MQSSHSHVLYSNTEQASPYNSRKQDPFSSRWKSWVKCHWQDCIERGIKMGRTWQAMGGAEGGMAREPVLPLKQVKIR